MLCLMWALSLHPSPLASVNAQSWSQVMVIAPPQPLMDSQGAAGVAACSISALQGLGWHMQTCHHWDLRA